MMAITPQTPPTTVPVLQRITQNIVDTLATITITNGYSFDAKVVQLNPGIPEPTEDGAILVELMDPSEDEVRPQTQEQYRQVFRIASIVRIDEKSETLLETVRTLRRAEVEWCLTHEAVFGGDRPNQTRGALAEDTKIVGTELPMLDSTSYETIFALHAEVLYKTKYSNPFASVYDA